MAGIVRRENSEIVLASELEMRSEEIKEKMAERKMYRRIQRNHRQRRAKKADASFFTIF